MEVKFKRYLFCATARVKKTENSPGYDLFLPETKFVRAHSCEMIRTNL